MTPLLFALLVSIAADAAPLPQTYAALAKTLPKAKSDRVKPLLVFASDERVAIGDRFRAIDLALKSMKSKDAARIDGEILLARIEGVRGRDARRKGALIRAQKLARTQKSARLDVIEGVLDADAHRARLSKAVRRRRAPGPLTDDERALLDVTSAAKDLKRALHHHAATSLTLLAAIANEKWGAPDDALMAALVVVELAKETRDATSFARDARQMRSRIFEQRQQLFDAAKESLAADLLVVSSSARPAFDVVIPNTHVRSVRTNSLCRKMAATESTCVDVERALKCGPTFFDHSNEKSVDGFDHERAAVVLDEFQPLLFDCVKAAAKARTLDARHLEIEWTVKNNGHVDGARVKPDRVAVEPFQSCINDAAKMFRYPQYEGEFHHVVLPFDIGD